MKAQRLQAATWLLLAVAVVIVCQKGRILIGCMGLHSLQAANCGEDMWPLT